LESPLGTKALRLNHRFIAHITCPSVGPHWRGGFDCLARLFRFGCGRAPNFYLASPGYAVSVTQHRRPNCVSRKNPRGKTSRCNDQNNIGYLNIVHSPSHEKRPNLTVFVHCDKSVAEAGRSDGKKRSLTGSYLEEGVSRSFFSLRTTSDLFERYC